MITYNEQYRTFELKNQYISYVFSVEKEKYLVSQYFGQAIKNYVGSQKHYHYDRGFCSNPDSDDKAFSLDTALCEYPDAYQGNFSAPAFRLRSSDGDGVTRFFFAGYKIFNTKNVIPNLPYIRQSSNVQIETLEVYLYDASRKLKIILVYNIYDKFAIITRSVKIENLSSEVIQLQKIMSINLDLWDSNWEVVTLTGSHLNEKQFNRRPLSSDIIRIESIRGTSSPQSSPFIGLFKPETNERSGEAIGITLLYSGSFEGSVVLRQYGSLRVQMGINSDEFLWNLKPQETFYAPEAVMAFSSNGINDLSHQFHRLFSECLIPIEFQNKERPILINSWEAYYFDIDENKILELAKKSRDLGIELIVVDDGWFKNRNSDNSSLGDWIVDKQKFPSGLASLANKIRDLGLEFGIWFEPEMISLKSDLYNQHPEWVISSRRYDPILSRNQLVLDLSNPDVCQYLVESLSKIIDETKLSYIKWDMNRHLTDLFSNYLLPDQQKEFSHRYVLGLYSILSCLRSKFPHVLFENCSSGGGRNDAGMLFYMPQTWLSDNTDAIGRLSIQNGTSLVFPCSSFGNHVSSIPNHQLNRVTSLNTRFNVACMGTFGYELDILSLSEEECLEIKRQIIEYKRYRQTFQFGTFYRLSDSISQRVNWQVISKDQRQVIVVSTSLLYENVYKVPIIKLQGLDCNKCYKNIDTNEVFGGDELMYAGITLSRVKGDFISQRLIFEVC